MAKRKTDRADSDGMLATISPPPAIPSRERARIADDLQQATDNEGGVSTKTSPQIRKVTLRLEHASGGKIEFAEHIELEWSAAEPRLLSWKCGSKLGENAKFAEAETIIDTIVKTVNRGYAVALRDGSELRLSPDSDRTEMVKAIGDALMIASDYRFRLV